MIGRFHGNNYSAVIRNVDEFGQQVEYDYLDLRPRLVDIKHPDNSQYVPQEDDNWSRVAWRFLGNGRYYWIIADYSQVLDLFEELGPIVVERARTQLSANLTAGATITSALVVRGRELQRGTTLRIWRGDNSASLDVRVSAVDPTTAKGLVGECRVTFPSPVVVPGGPGILAVGSRVTEVMRQDRPLVIPSVTRALFNAMDFGNPMNTLVVD